MPEVRVLDKSDKTSNISNPHLAQPLEHPPRKPPPGRVWCDKSALANDTTIAITHPEVLPPTSVCTHGMCGSDGKQKSCTVLHAFKVLAVCKHSGAVSAPPRAVDKYLMKRVFN